MAGNGMPCTDQVSVNERWAAYERQKRKVAAFRERWLSASQASLSASQASARALRAERDVWEAYQREASLAVELLEQVTPVG